VLCHIDVDAIFFVLCHIDVDAIFFVLCHVDVDAMFLVLCHVDLDAVFLMSITNTQCFVSSHVSHLSPRVLQVHVFFQERILND